MRTSKTINKYVIYFIMIFPLIVPEGGAVLFGPIYSLIYKYGRLLSIGIASMLYFVKLKNGKVIIPSHYRIILLLSMYCLFITIINGHNFSDWVSAFWPCIMAGLIVEYGKRDTDKVINVVLITLEFWIYVNLVFMLRYPNGMYVSTRIGYTKNWILGYKSSFQYMIFPAVILGWLRSEYGGSKVRFWLLILVSGLETFLSGNAMLVVALAVFAVFYVFKLIELRKIFRPIVYSSIILAVNALLIFGLTYLVNTKFVSMFLGYYGKSTTLGGRASYIWPITIRKIANNPIFGYGIWSSDERRALYLNRPAAIHAHNQLLEMLFVGGIIYIVLYTIFHIKMLKSVNNYENKPVTKILFFGLFIFYCMMSVEIFLRHTAFPIWIIIFLAFIVRNIDEKLSSELGRKYIKEKTEKNTMKKID